jgi:hypothetical protein
MPLNDTSELEKELRTSGTEYDDLDFNRYLKQANQKLKGMVGRVYIDRKRIEFEDEQDVDLDFVSLESFDKVVDKNGNDIIDSSNYSVDLTTGVVTFDQSYVDDNFSENTILEFRYVPTIFKTLEVKQAHELIQSQETTVTGDSVDQAQTSQLEETIKQLMYDINSRNSSGVQRGDNQNRGSQSPRTFT